MAVYTDLDQKTVSRFLASHYDLGKALAFKGIPEGIQNSNYYLKTEKGEYILTLVERRTPEADLPYFLDYMAHLSGKGFPCPRPVASKSGNLIQKLAEKPAIIVTFLPGKADMQPTPGHCYSAGALIAKLHRAGKGFKKTRENLFSLKRLVRMFRELKPEIGKNWPGLDHGIEEELAYQVKNQPRDLPLGPIHTDIFPDNVFFEGERATGLIDFFFSCTNFLAYDLAIALGSWCFEKTGNTRRPNFKRMVEGYESIRPLEKAERRALPVLLRKSSLASLITRLEDVLHPPENVLGVQKDPFEYRKILANQQKKSHIREYF